MVAWVFVADLNEGQQFSHLAGYYNEFDSLSQTEDLNNNLDYLNQQALENNVFLVKIAYESNDDGDKTIYYYSGNDLENILKLTNSKYKVTNENINCASTISSDSCKFKINDILKDRKIKVVPLEELFTSDNYCYGEYRLFYQDGQGRSNFIDSINNRFGMVLKPIAKNDNMIDNNTNLLVAMIILIFILFYLVMEIYNIYNYSRKIGIMKMMGIGIDKVYYNLAKNDILFYLLISLGLLTILKIFVPGITWEVILQILIIYLLTCVVFILLSFISLWIVYGRKSMIDILKNKVMVSSLLNVCSIYKAITSILVLVLLFMTFSTANSYLEKVKRYQKMLSVKDYAFFAYVQDYGDNSIHDKAGEFNKLYAELGKSDLDYLYEEFNNFDIYPDNDLKLDNEAIEQGTFFPMGTVDYNYLKQSGFKIYDEEGNEVTLTKKDYEYFLFPTNETKYYQAFIKYYETKTADYNLKTDYSLYTYTGEIKRHMIDSNYSDIVKSRYVITAPIIRVIYDEFPINYLNDFYGIDLIGTGYQTGLKFKINNNLEEVKTKLGVIIKNLDLDKIFVMNNFVTATDLMGNEMNNYRNALLVRGFLLLLSIFIYLIITIETNYLWLEKKEKELSIRLLLGYSRPKTFKSIFLFDLLTVLIGSIIGIIVCVLIQSKLTLNMFLAVLCLVTFETIVFVATSSRISFDKLKLFLKGEK